MAFNRADLIRQLDVLNDNAAIDLKGNENPGKAAVALFEPIQNNFVAGNKNPFGAATQGISDNIAAGKPDLILAKFNEAIIALPQNDRDRADSLAIAERLKKFASILEENGVLQNGQVPTIPDALKPDVSASAAAPVTPEPKTLDADGPSSGSALATATKADPSPAATATTTAAADPAVAASSDVSSSGPAKPAVAPPPPPPPPPPLPSDPAAAATVTPAASVTTDPAKPAATPPADPVKAANEAAEAARRAQEQQQLLDMKIARAAWYRDSFMEGRDFDTSPRGEVNPRSKGGIDAGIEFRTDVKINEGRYYPIPPDELNTSLSVNKDGVIRLFHKSDLSEGEKRAAIKNAVDFFGSHGESSITLNFDKPGPYSLPIVFQTLAQATNRGLEVKFGPEIANYMANLTEKDLKAMPKEVKAEVNKYMKAHEGPFNDWKEKNGLTNKKLDIRYLGQYMQERSKESAKRVTDITLTQGDGVQRHNLQAYEHAYRIDKSQEALASNAKLGEPDVPVVPKAGQSMEEAQKEYKESNKEAVREAYKEQMFGADHDGKSLGDRVSAVAGEMESIEKRKTDLAERVEKLDNEMRQTVDKHLESKDPNILMALHDRLQLVEASRDLLVQEMQAQKADLDKRYDVCAAEAGKLVTEAKGTPDENKATDLKSKADKYLDAASSEKDSSKGMEKALGSIDENKGYLSKDFVTTKMPEAVAAQEKRTEEAMERYKGLK